MVIILDDEDRENEGDLIMAAEHATPEAVAFMIRHTSGIICVPMEDERLARLDLPQMVPNNDDAYRTAFTVSVDYRLRHDHRRLLERSLGHDPGARGSDIRCRRISRGPGTSSRCVRARAACSCAPATPKRRWICASSPACSPPACCAS